MSATMTVVTSTLLHLVAVVIVVVEGGEGGRGEEGEEGMLQLTFCSLLLLTCIQSGEHHYPSDKC